tara:strand:- start:334 stop:852 length:519 start_codon:yes stop_codon:yes gene_type:complete
MIVGIICQHRSGHSAYEQFISEKENLKLCKEVNINVKDHTNYFENLPEDAIFSVMPFNNLHGYVKKHQKINWQILLRRDVFIQCLSFVYTNKTQIFRDDQNKIVDVDVGLVEYFFQNWQLINEIKETNKYPVYYYEDLRMPNDKFFKNNNDYSKLIKNIDAVRSKIQEFTNA